MRIPGATSQLPQQLGLISLQVMTTTEQQTNTTNTHTYTHIHCFSKETGVNEPKKLSGSSMSLTVWSLFFLLCPPRGQLYSEERYP